jgi:hypothetical protein
MKKITLLLILSMGLLIGITTASAYEYETILINPTSNDQIRFNCETGDRVSVKIDCISNQINYSFVDEANFVKLSAHQRYESIKQEILAINDSNSWEYDIPQRGKYYLILENPNLTESAIVRVVSHKYSVWLYTAFLIVFIGAGLAVGIAILGRVFETRGKINTDRYTRYLRANSVYAYGRYLCYLGETLIVVQSVFYLITIGMISNDIAYYAVIAPAPAFLFLESWLYVCDRYRIKGLTSIFYFLLLVLCSASLFIGGGWYFGLIFSILGGVMRIGAQKQ